MSVAAIEPILGAVGAAKGMAPKKVARKASTRPLVAEFIVCTIILAFSPLAADTKPGQWMKRGTAICGVFLVLGLVASIGPKSSRGAAGFGALVTVGLVVDQRGLFTEMAKLWGKVGGGDDDESADGPPDQKEEVGSGGGGGGGDSW